MTTTKTDGCLWIRPMRSRDPQEAHRPATPLELLYDLCFVVAIAIAASELHHGLAENHVAESIVSYAMVFFAIWWAWMNFTWFASAYDTDDVPYRLKVLVQMAGVLILAAGIPRGFEHQDFSVITVGYCVMRTALVAQWLRAARCDPERRTTALRYVFGVLVCQFGWIGLLFLPPSLRLGAWIVLVPAELAVPGWAERAARTPWHPHHIAERYGLLTIIVLGESVLAASFALQGVVDAGSITLPFLRTFCGGLVILFSLWWIYFDDPAHRVLTSSRAAFRWGYAHYFVFACAAAVGAGLALRVDVLGHHAHVAPAVAGCAVGFPVALFVLLVWWLHGRATGASAVVGVSSWLAAVAALAASFSPWPVLLVGLVVAGLVAVRVNVRSAGR